MHRTHAWLSLFAVAVCLTAATRGDEWGTIKGRLVFAGAPADSARPAARRDKGRLKVNVKAAGTDLGAITIDADAFRR
jgi:hypothetical protein